MLERLKEMVASFSTAQRIFLLCAMACSFFISFDYAIVRPVSNSLFIQGFGAKALPYVWMLSVPINFAVVSLYNRLVSKLSCFRLFLLIATTVAIGNLAAATFIHMHKSIAFIFYAWKDIYVMLMFQLLWSVIHSTIDTSKAKYLYGFLFAVGASGGLLGSMVAGSLAVELGSESLLYFTLAIYSALAISYFFLVRFSGACDSSLKKDIAQKSSIKDSLLLITKSKLLLSILLMVVFMQLTATLTDFQFNTYIEKLLPQKDIRTAYLGKLLSVGNLITMALQLFGVYILIRTLGKYKTHLLVPSVLCISSISFGLYPSFALISFAFITIKAFDFSLFNVIKEMLYIPLRSEEKFRAKALIDVFMYRGAKVFASAFVLGLQAFFSSHLITLIAGVNTALFLVWMFVVYSIRKSYDAETLSPKTSPVSTS